MVVKCINSGDYHLTVGKVYLVAISLKYTDKYVIDNDWGFRHFVEPNLFIDVSDHRENLINEILE